MAQQKLIASVEVLRDDSVLICLQDQTAIRLTLEQILSLGAPRIVIDAEEGNFEQALRTAVERYV